MNPNDGTKKVPKPVWPGRASALRRLLLITLVLFPCTWVVNALLIGSWNLLGDRNAESIRHLREAAGVFIGTTCVIFLVSLLPTFYRLFSWLFSWRIVRRVLIVAAWAVTLVALFYGEENWRGRRAWDKYSETLKAQGEVLDFKDFVPKAIPDSENFAATPEFNSWFVRNTNTGGPVVLDKWQSDNFGRAARRMSLDVDKPPRRIMDLVAWQMAFDAVRLGETNSTQEFKSDKLDLESRAKAAPAVLEALKPLDGLLEELRAASQRPHARFPLVYDLENPWAILLPHLSQLRAVCLRLELRACAELALSQNDRALADVKLMLRLADSPDEEPILISYLVRLVNVRFAIQPVWEGLAEHRWTDAQLQELQTLFQRYNFVADMKMPLDGERAAGILTANLLERGKYTFNDIGSPDPNSDIYSSIVWIGRIMPGGWYDREKLSYCRLYNLQFKNAFDGPQKRVFPQKIAANSTALKQAIAGRDPFTIVVIRHELLATTLLSEIGKIPARGAAAQVLADQALLGCALERYRLVHGQFPENLAALTPEFINAMPHDVITGEPYKYRRTDDDQFLLYSVGWNETDDDGSVILKNDKNDQSADVTKGDWVWEYPAK